jgi:AcrR family transcriptional regulator
VAVEQPGGRRRGAALEASILEAVWAELAEVGYAKLTMEGVAARAHTGKQVLYRRWRNRAELVIMAMRHNTYSIADRIPDTGSLRDDVIEVLGQLIRRQREIGADVFHGLLAEAPDLGPEFFTVMNGVMGTVLKQAEQRGELNLAGVSPRVLTLPADLLRHEMLLGQSAIAESTALEIVDEVFLPLIRATAGGPAPE